MLEEIEMITGAWYLPMEQKRSDLSRAVPYRETGKPGRNPGNKCIRKACCSWISSVTRKSEAL